jgi:N6-adenosine-specific RNA methylase IME4
MPDNGRVTASEALARRSGPALPSIERARSLLAAARTAYDVRKIRAVAQAVATLERGKEIACDAGEIIVLADTRRAELEAEERTTRRRNVGRKGNPRGNPLPAAQKTAESKRAPLLALPEQDRVAYFAACRRALQPATTSGAATLARLEPTARRRAVALLGAATDVPRAIGELRAQARRAVAARIAAEPMPMPAGPFRVIVADPPWPYRSGASPYPTMSVGAMCALPVRALAHRDAILWLWTTNAFMREAFEVLDAWGFAEKTILTWAKTRMGTGDWLRGKTEHCILAVRGKPVVTLTRETTLLVADGRGHSRKPDAFYTLVESLCPGSKVELFARRGRPGWAAWGAETGERVPGPAPRGRTAYGR